MHFSGQSHSFDIATAAKYGVEEAILIHHFQHWIRINTKAGRNKKEFIHNGEKIQRYFTYQSRKEIQLHFPYWNYDRVRYLCEKLVEQGVLFAINLNKNPIDKTLWYAFVDPDEFGLDEHDVNKYYDQKNVYERGNPRSEEKTTQPIPDTITSYTLKKKKSGEPGPAACSHPEAGNASLLLLEAIKKTKPDIKEPTFLSMHQEMARMLNIDKRNIETVRKLIAWLPTSEFWRRNILSADKFRKQFDRLELEMNEQKNARKGTSDDLQLIKKLEEYLRSSPHRNIVIGADYVDFISLHNCCFKAGDKDFKTKVITILEKIGIPIK